MQSRLDDFAHDAPGALSFLRPRATPEGYVEHPLLKDRVLKTYPFQLTVASEAAAADTLVVLPTGLGKTVVAALVTAERLSHAATKVLFLAPTKPLVVQHYRSFSTWFRSLPSAVFTGEVSKPVREGDWETATAVFATPQLVVHDLLEGRYSLKDIGLVIYDEAHHGRGKYAYAKIAAIYQTQGPAIRRQLALTASPGDPKEILAHLHLASAIVRSREDEDVAPFVQTVETSLVRVALSEDQKAAVEELRGAAREEMVRLQRYGLLRTRKLAVTSIKDLVAARKQLFALPIRMGARFQALVRIALAQHLLHAVELIEREGFTPFLGYLERVQAQPKLKKADKLFLEHEALARAKELAGASGDGTNSHPKQTELLSLVSETLKEKPDAKILVFTEYRDSVRSLVDMLKKEGLRVERFVGQAHRSEKDRGMAQRHQLSVLDAFKSGRFNILVASRVAEEGLDIPQVDLVVEYDVLSSGVRTTQRMGRTGRTMAGRVVTLLSEGTKEERYRVKGLVRAARSRRELRKVSTGASGPDGPDS
ncbi:MAG: DEAD/DEAH box helicase family protein [Candidatus Thermoplasmatota archaeon]|jgi:Fanconi anemia group M protein|nr:DEAD/DEAH box helicase family protein [Candidatus Thermoplasmatota archaeon]MCL5984770.1 DEAD/DEAH box helicase family protein [Candidatus Thermoplasmatota archaeon]